jgi:hypothetical protein
MNEIKVSNLYAFFNQMYWRIKHFATTNNKRKQLTLMQIVQSSRACLTLESSSIFCVVNSVVATGTCPTSCAHLASVLNLSCLV